MSTSSDSDQCSSSYTDNEEPSADELEFHSADEFEEPSGDEELSADEEPARRTTLRVRKTNVRAISGDTAPRLLVGVKYVRLKYDWWVRKLITN